VAPIDFFLECWKYEEPDMLYGRRFQVFLLNKVDGKLGVKFSAFPFGKLISVLS